MANWASTSYVIEGPEETLKRIDEAIKQSISNPPEDADKGWEGSVLINLGMSREKIDKAHTRGFIQEDASYLGNAIQIYAEKAWGLQDFNDLLKEIFSEIKVYWIVEEVSNGVLATNDKKCKYFPEIYYIDACVNGEYYNEYFEIEQSLYNWISKITNGKVNTSEKVEKFNDRAEDKGLDDYIHIFKIEIVD